MQFTVITGISGAGKTKTLRFLEDMGFFCMDNLPPAIIPGICELFISASEKYDNVAFVIDSRVGSMIGELLINIKILRKQGYECRLLFLDADDDILVKRYKETRRNHPISTSGGLLESIKEERALLEKIKQEADFVIDTSGGSSKQLLDKLRDCLGRSRDEEFVVNILSFGFKYGLPLDADMVFDARCFINPFYVEELKNLTGNEKAVQDYVMSETASEEFLARLTGMVNFLMPKYIEEGRGSLCIAIGCTGGKHRSVTFANKLAEAIPGRKANVIHRDILRGRE